MLSEKDAILRLGREEVDASPFQIKVIDTEYPLSERRYADVLLDLEWKGTKRRFAAEYKSIPTPKHIAIAIEQAKVYSRVGKNLLPMIMVPYISKQTADRLLEENVSGIDFSGNLVVTVPGEWLVCRVGNPNRFPSSQPIKNIFEGKSALVGRVLLSQPEYDMIQEVRDEIVERGTSISLGTVSKVLSKLEQELIIRKNGNVKLIQPDRLLDQLVQNYRGPSVARRLEGKVPERSSFTKILSEAKRRGIQVAGRSEEMYVLAPSSVDRKQIYVSQLGKWLKETQFKETVRFPNIELIEVEDDDVFFDTQIQAGFPWCSRLQIYLELMLGGKREREVASQLRTEILAKTKVEA